MKQITNTINGSNDSSCARSKQRRHEEKWKETRALSGPAGLHYFEMKIQAGAPPVEVIGRLAQ